MTPDHGKQAAPCGSGRGWWAVYAKHQHEKMVAEVLSMKGCRVFLPLYNSRRKWKDRKVSVPLPLFPGYVFVWEQMEYRLAVLTTPGVHMIIARGNQFAVIPPEEMEAIQRAVEVPSGATPHPFLSIGQKVRVLGGTLAGVTGILVRQKNLCRLVVSVDMLAQSVAVEVDAADVVAVEQEHHLAPHARMIGDCRTAGAVRVATLEIASERIA